MGKKDRSGAKKRRREEDEQEAQLEHGDTELDAEMRALNEVRAEQGKGGAGGKAPMVYNNRALIAKTDEIALELDFPQTLAVVSRVPLAEAIDNADDDLKRETAFYAQAQAAVAEARKRLDGMNVPYLRPDDYYAEMLKSDNHMQRIRDSLLFEERKMAAFERRKKNQEHKKFGKQLNAEKIKNKAAEKRAAIDAIKQIRKRRKNNNGFDIDIAVEQELGKKKGGGRRGFKSAGGRAGGGYRGAGGSGGGSGGSRGNDGNKKGGKKTNRPGKSRRNRERGKR